jgi:hypothetical protein
VNPGGPLWQIGQISIVLEPQVIFQRKHQRHAPKIRKRFSYGFQYVVMLPYRIPATVGPPFQATAFRALHRPTLSG